MVQNTNQHGECGHKLFKLNLVQTGAAETSNKAFGSISGGITLPQQCLLGLVSLTWAEHSIPVSQVNRTKAHCSSVVYGEKLFNVR